MKRKNKGRMNTLLSKAKNSFRRTAVLAATIAVLGIGCGGAEKATQADIGPNKPTAAETGPEKDEPEEDLPKQEPVPQPAKQSGPIREYSADVEEKAVYTVTYEIAVDLEGKEFAQLIEDGTLYTAFFNGMYYKWIDLGSACFLNVVKATDFCKVLKFDVNAPVSFFIFPEYIRACMQAPEIYDAFVEGWRNNDTEVKFTGSNLEGKYTKTGADDFLFETMTYTHNPSLVYTWTYTDIKEDEGAVERIVNKAVSFFETKKCQVIEQ